MINTKEHFVDRASILPRHQIKGFNSFGLSLAYRISVNHCKGIAGTEAGCFTLQRAILTLVDFNFPFLIFTQFWIFLPHLYDERTSFLSSLLIIRKQEIFVSWNGKRWFRGWKSSYVSVLTPLRLTALKQIDCHLKKLITKHNFAIYRRHSCNPPIASKLTTNSSTSKSVALPATLLEQWKTLIFKLTASRCQDVLKDTFVVSVIYRL